MPSHSVVSDSLQPMDSNMPGFHGISLARTLELDAISSSRGSSLSRDLSHGLTPVALSLVAQYVGEGGQLELSL